VGPFAVTPTNVLPLVNDHDNDYRRQAKSDPRQSAN
jgi:hypothetical protein